MKRNSTNGDGKKKRPKTNGSNGRKTNGTFAKGNKGGPGRPQSNRSQLVSVMMDDLITEDRTKTIIARWLDEAAAGEPWAVKEFLDRCLGKAHQSVTMDGELRLTLADVLSQLRTDPLELPCKR